MSHFRPFPHFLLYRSTGETWGLIFLFSLPVAQGAVSRDITYIAPLLPHPLPPPPFLPQPPINSSPPVPPLFVLVSLYIVR